MSHRPVVEDFEMVPPTGAGRLFSTTRRVRLGDVTPRARMRLDAIARFLQDIANDDSRDARWSDPHWWVVRRTVLEITEFPSYLQEVVIETWCGGVGSHWAERRTRIASLDGAVLVDAAALWVHVDERSLSPSRIPEDVLSTLEESAAGRRIGARLLLRAADFPAESPAVLPWQLRFSDFDAVGHVNNSAYWEVLEEQLAVDKGIRSPMRAVVEHLVQVEPGMVLVRHIATGDRESSIRMLVGSVAHAAAWCGAINAG